MSQSLPPQIEGYSYVCRVSRSNGGQVDLPATYNSPDSLTCTVDASDVRAIGWVWLVSSPAPSSPVPTPQWRRGDCGTQHCVAGTWRAGPRPG